MSTKVKFVVGSLVGAIVVHVAFVACNNAPSTSEVEDAGLVDAMIDAFTNLVDSSTKDAKAETDAATCSCVPTTSGSRLKGVFTAGADGSKSYVHRVWWDSKLQAQCGPSELKADNKQYCLPRSATVVFLDAACTQRLAFLQPGLAKSKYASQFGAGAVISKFTESLYTLGATAIAPTAQVYTLDVTGTSGGGCIPTAIQPGVQWFEVGALSPPSDFVELSEGHD
jgi:hypothetical protein